MIIGPPPKFHGTWDILVSGRGDVSAWAADLQELGDIPPSWKHH